MEGELHWIYSAPEAAKTWVALALLKFVLDGGGVVLWVDEELGYTEIARRLLYLGADPDAVTERFIYNFFPAWGTYHDDDQEWEEMATILRPDLVVIDTVTDAFAEAGVDENSGLEVTRWVKTYLEPPRRLGAAIACLDHTTKDGGNIDYAIGTRAKRAKAKVQYHLSIAAKDRFDDKTEGVVKVTRTKNTVAAALSKRVRKFRIGGGENRPGGFTFRPLKIEDALHDVGREREEQEGRKATALEDAVTILGEARNRGEGDLTQTELVSRIGGKAAEVREVLEAATEDAASGIGRRPGPRGRYFPTDRG